MSHKPAGSGEQYKAHKIQKLKYKNTNTNTNTKYKNTNTSYKIKDTKYNRQNTKLLLANKFLSPIDVQAVGVFSGDNGGAARGRRCHLCAYNTNSMGRPVDQVFALVFFETNNVDFIYVMEGRLSTFSGSPLVPLE